MNSKDIDKVNIITPIVKPKSDRGILFLKNYFFDCLRKLQRYESSIFSLKN